MPIVSSIIVADDVQADRRRAIRERHTDQVGVIYEFGYLIGEGADTAPILSARAASLANDIVALEIARNINDVVTSGSLASPTFVYSTAAQNVAALRAAYLVATREEAIMIGDFLEAIMIGDSLSSLTDGQLRTAFGLTANQVTTLRTNKLTPAASLAASIRAATGG